MHGHKTMKNGNEVATGLNLTCRRNVTQRDNIFELSGESVTNSERNLMFFWPCIMN